MAEDGVLANFGPNAGADPEIEEGRSTHGDWCGRAARTGRAFVCVCVCVCAYKAQRCIGGSGSMLPQENFQV